MLLLVIEAALLLPTGWAFSGAAPISRY